MLEGWEDLLPVGLDPLPGQMAFSFLETVRKIGPATLHLSNCIQVIDGMHEPVTVISDPPYGISVKKNDKSGKYRRGRWRVPGDHNALIGQQCIDLCRRKGWPVCAFASPKCPWDGLERTWLVWDKGPAVGGGGDIKTCWKPTWELIQVDGNRPLNGKRDSAVLRFWTQPNAMKFHPSQKPVELMRYLVSKLTQPGEIVFDPFMGSGSTAIACILEGRRFVGCEIDPEYFATAVDRITVEFLASLADDALTGVFA